jgi:hypothetical protein
LTDHNILYTIRVIWRLRMQEPVEITAINWDSVKFNYEVLGHSEKAIKEKWGISDSLFEYVSRNWKRHPVSQRKEINFRPTADINELTVESIQSVSNEVELTNLIKQRYINELSVELEHTLLVKALSISHTLPEDSSSINSIRNLVGILHKIIGYNPIVNPIKTDEGSTVPQDNTVRIEIVDADSSPVQAKAVSDAKEKV